MKTIKTYYLSTFDNPHDPITEWDDWYMWDKDYGHNCCEILADISPETDEMTEEEIQDVRRKAIDRFIVNDPFNIYKRVVGEKQIVD